MDEIEKEKLDVFYPDIDDQEEQRAFNSTLSSVETSAFLYYSPKEIERDTNYTVEERKEEDNKTFNYRIDLGCKFNRNDYLFLEFLNGMDPLKYTPDTRILARFLFSIYASEKDCLVHRIPLSDYFTLRNIKDNKENRITLKSQLKTLSGCRLDINTANTWKECQFIVEPEIDRGNIVFSFGPKFAMYILSNISTPPYPNALFSLSGKFDGNAFLIGDKLTTHKYQNYGRENVSTISVEKLLKVTDLPEEDYLKSLKSRPSTRYKISVPFISALEKLNNLNGLHKTFKIAIFTPDGKRVFYNGEFWVVTKMNTYEKYDTDKLYDYQELKKCSIDFDIVEYPKVLPADKRLEKSRAIEQKQTKKKK